MLPRRGEEPGASSDRNRRGRRTFV